MEHRGGQRVVVTRPVRLRGPTSVTARAFLRDLSVSGAFIETAVPFVAHSRVHVQLFDLRSAGLVEGVIARVEPSGIAVEWCELAPAGVQSVLDAAKRQSQPSLRSRSLLL